MNVTIETNVMSLTSSNKDDLQHLANLILNSSLSDFPDDLIPLAIEHQLGPFVLFCLTNAKTLIDNEVHLQNLKTDARQHMIMHLLQEKSMFEVNQAFQDVGIKCVWLKGVALGLTIYPESHLRVKGDLDCLVSLDDFSHALKVLQSMDFVKPENLFGATALDRLSHHEHLVHSQFSQLHLELHHRLLGHGGKDDLPVTYIQQWIDESIAFTVDSQTFYTFKPEHHILYLCAHCFLQHGESTASLRDLLDIHLLLTSYDVDWELLTKEAIDLGWAFLLKHVLTMVTKYFETPIPVETWDVLAIEQPETETMNRIFLKGFDDSRGESLLHVLGQLTLRERAHTLRQVVFPPSEYMRQRYSIADNFPTLPYYFYRIGYQTLGFVKAIIRRTMLDPRQTHISKHDDN